MQVSLVKIISYSISFTFSFDVRIRSRDSSRILRKQSALCQLFFRVGIPIWDVRAVLTEREGSLSFLRAVAICGVWRVCFEGALSCVPFSWWLIPIILSLQSTRNSPDVFLYSSSRCPYHTTQS